MTEPRAPRRHRRPDWRPVFFATIRATGNVRLSASAAGIDRTSAYRRANRDPAFAAAWEDAWQDSIDDLEGEARRRALEKSDALLMFQLRAYRPERYRESFNVRVDVRREAERIAARFGVPVEDVLDRLERQAEEALKK
jgi:hypothetical protein